MASGVITGDFTGGSSSSHFTYKLIWSSSPDPARLRSLVTLGWYVTIDANGWHTNKNNAAWSWTTNIGESDSGYESFNYPNPQDLVAGENNFYRSDSIYVPHNPDGTKNFTISGDIDLSGTSAGTGSLSGTIVLDRIAVNPPTVNTFTISDIGTGQSSVGAYVAGFTKLRFSATATAGDGTIKTYSFYRGTTLLGAVNTSNTTATFDMTSFEQEGSYVYSVTVTDSYGLSATKSLASTTISPYALPTISATTYRCNSGGTADNEGTYGYCNMSYTVANVGSNSATVHKVTINNSTYTTFPKVVSGINTTSSYSAVYVVTDKLGVSATITQTIQPSFINFDLFPSTSGGAAYGEASQQGKFIVNLPDSIFRGGIFASGALTGGGINFASVTEYFDTDTTISTNTSIAKSYTASGAGIVIASVSVKTDGTSDYGTTSATVLKNNTTYAYSMNRFGENNSGQFGANAVAVMKVAANDTIDLWAFSSKTGTKTGLFNLLAIGCTLS